MSVDLILHSRNNIHMGDRDQPAGQNLHLGAVSANGMDMPWKRQDRVEAWCYYGGACNFEIVRGFD